MRGNKELTAKRTSAGKAQPGSTSVDIYFARLPEPARTRLDELRNLIRSAVPSEAAECISYSMPAFRYKGALVCYGAFTNRYSLFPMNAQLIADLGNEISAYKTSKGTLQIPLDTPPPKALIRKIVKMRVAQNQKRKKS
jgi:uncharacterized protein YdhG (YjbR/CyaY superfamily)